MVRSHRTDIVRLAGMELQHRATAIVQPRDEEKLGSTLNIFGWVLEADDFAGRVVFLGQGILRVRVGDGQHVSGADPLDNKVLLINRDDSVSFFEYRVIIHGDEMPNPRAAARGQGRNLTRAVEIARRAE
jgi:hypothetical protein